MLGPIHIDIEADDDNLMIPPSEQFFEFNSLDDVVPPESVTADQNVATATSMIFTKEELDGSTNCFSDDHLIGEGGFGRVFKAELRFTTVAVKVLNEDGVKAMIADCGDNLFSKEITALTKFRHPNLVPLMGYCASPPAMVLEYMEGGSLYSALHQRKIPIGWQMRVRILQDTIKGLAYLHAAKPPLVHQDIKSHNILIDDKGNGRIGDFGFSIELPQQQAGRSLFTSKYFAKSDGYYGTEVATGMYSAKSDTYSYGIVTLEVYTGLIAFDKQRKDPSLIDHCDEAIKDFHVFKTLKDSKLKKPGLVLGRIEKFWRIVTNCTMKYSARPTSEEVLRIW
jgi:serine/threonine protein kinase